MPTCWLSTKIARSVQHDSRNTDERDAELLLGVLRAHVLAGNPLPAVWIPDPQTRDDRELVRTRLDLASKLSAIKAQIQGLLKRNYRERPEEPWSKGWTRAFVSWLRGLTGGQELAVGAAAAQRPVCCGNGHFWEEEIEKRFPDEQLYRLAEVVSLSGGHPADDGP